MLKVYLIDDEDKLRHKFTEMVNDIIIENKLFMKIEISTTKVKDIIHSLENNSERGIYILDINLADEINGIELAELIRKYDSDSNIIFVSTYSEFCDLTIEYKVKALEFIEKGSDNDIQSRLRKCLINIVNSRNEKGNKYIRFKCGERVVELLAEEICFIEYIRKSKKVLVHSENRLIEVDGDISGINEKIGDEFILMNKNLYVNSHNIKDVYIDEKILVMKNGESCYFGKRYFNNIKRIKK